MILDQNKILNQPFEEQEGSTTGETVINSEELENQGKTP